MSQELKLLNSYEVFDYTPEMVKESREKNDGKVVMKGILQKADTLNQNGRIYPLHVLEREVRNYQKFISENRSLGECVPPGTEIYTRDGWKNIEDIADDEVIFTLNIQKRETQLQRISRKVVLPFEGEMIRFRNAASIDMCLTPNHKMLLWDRNGSPYTLTAQDFYEGWSRKDSRLSHSSVRKTGGDWRGDCPEFFSIGKHQIDVRLWAAFLGIYLAEGCSSGVNVEARIDDHRVQITQKDAEVSSAIHDLMEKLPFNYKIQTRADGQTKDFIIKDVDLHQHLLPLGNSRQKYVPVYAKSWSSEVIDVMLTWMLMGDGRHRSIGGRPIDEYCTVSSRLAADVEELMFKTGDAATIHVWDRSQDRKGPDDRTILGENCADMNVVYRHKARDMGLDFRFLKVEKSQYIGNVYCVTVPNGTWLMRYNGRVCWTHNCDHPDSSVVNLKNVSHIVREAYIDKGVVYGTVELLDTPSGKILQSLVESGVKLGISSRGVGTTKKQGDYHIVQDDFQLICWDYVSEPSTPGAFMLPEGKTISDVDLRKVFNRSDRIDRIINDILTFSK